MTLSVGGIDLKSSVLLAPMAGITDVPFRDLVSKFGAGLVVSEMIASQEMVQQKPSTRLKAELGFAKENTSVQIAGRDAYWMAECARVCEANGARIIDINMGCPAKKVTSGASGSALMKEPELALQLIEAVVNAVRVPVTLKMRLGWDDNSLNAPQIAHSAQEAGIQLVTIHGRTRCQFYKGAADWAAIRDVVESVKIPVVANGDVVDAQTAKQALEQSGAKGVMVGRGVQGNPWKLAEIEAALSGKTLELIPRRSELVRLIQDHYIAILDFYGAVLGVKNARKHLGWYLADVPGANGLKSRLFRENNPDQVLQQLEELNSLPEAVQAAA